MSPIQSVGETPFFWYNLKVMNQIFSIFLVSSALALAANPGLGAEGRSLFEDQPGNQVEPLNLDKISKVFPEIMEYGYSGKVLLEFDIDSGGAVTNVRIIDRTRKIIFDKSAKNLLKRFRFEAGNPIKNARYEIGFCLQSDQVTPVFCNILYQRVGGPERPYVTVYSMPYYTWYQVRKSICGTVTVRFDVDNKGKIQNEKFISASRPGQFEIGLKRALERFKFEKGNPAQGIVYKVTYDLPGRC